MGSLRKCKKCGQLYVIVNSVKEPQKIVEEVGRNGSYLSSVDVYYNWKDPFNYKAKNQRLNDVVNEFPFLDAKDLSTSCLYSVPPAKKDLYERCIKKYRADNIILTGTNTVTCPVCGSPDIYNALNIVEPNHRVENHLSYRTDITLSGWTSRKRDFDEIGPDKIQNNIDNENALIWEPEYNETIQKCKNTVDQSKSITATNNWSIETYLKGALNIKTIEYALECRLQELVQKKITLTQDSINTECKIKNNEINNVRNELSNITSEIKQKTDASHITLSSDWYLECGIEKPVEPIKPKDFTMIAPTEPEYKKPGLFNKKAILAENEELKKQFDISLEEYNRLKTFSENEQEQYKKDYLDYTKKNRDFLVKGDEYLRKKRETWQNNLIANDSDLKQLDTMREKCEQILADPAPFVDNKIRNHPATLLKELNEQELDRCITCLKEVYQTEHDYLSPGILFPKYATLPAVTTMYEYFVTGRCSELTGPNGAYNLYESELRQNTIIEKLDVITYKLDEIKANQYTLYQAMQSVNAQLSSLNNAANNITKQLGTMNNTLSNIDSNVSDIRELSSVTAYNTAVTAYYSKANAELTNSLGYLIAMK